MSVGDFNIEEEEDLFNQNGGQGDGDPSGDGEEFQFGQLNGDEEEEDNNNPGDGDIHEEELDAVSVLNKLTGFEIDGEGFTDDIDGIANYIKAANEKYKETFENNFWETFKQNEHLHRLATVYLNGGDETFEEALSKIALTYQGFDEYKEEIKEGDNERARAIYQKALMQNPHIKPEHIKSIIDREEDEGSLLETAEKIRKELIASKETERARVLQEQEQKIQQREERRINNSKVIIDTVQSGDLDRFKIPEKEKAEFIKYLSENTYADDEGNIYTYKYIKDGKDLADVFYLYRKGNLDDLITVKASTKKALGLVDQYKQKNNNKNNNSQFEFGKLD